MEYDELRSWTAIGADAVFASRWSDAGRTPSDAGPWLSAGVLYPEDADLWDESRLGIVEAQSWSPIRAADAMVWRSHELTREDVLGWHGMPATQALQWRTAGFEPEPAAAFFRAGMDPEDARQWVDAGFQADDAAAWHGAGINPSEVGAWREQGLSGEVAKTWNAHGIPPQVVNDWLRAGSDAAEAALWRHLGDPSEAREWQRDGHTYEEALAWREAGATLRLATTYIRRRFSRDEAAPWIAEKIKVKPAIMWQKLGWDPADAGRWTRAGWGQPQHASVCPGRGSLSCGGCAGS